MFEWIFFHPGKVLVVGNGLQHYPPHSDFRVIDMINPNMICNISIPNDFISSGSSVGDGMAFANYKER